MYPGYFIVGVETPMGQFTYHYPMLHWGMFQVRELDKAPEWDGHTTDDVTRLHSIPVITWDLGKDITNEVMDETTFKKQYECNFEADQISRDNYIPLRSRADQE